MWCQPHQFPLKTDLFQCLFSGGWGEAGFSLLLLNSLLWKSPYKVPESKHNSARRRVSTQAAASCQSPGPSALLNSQFLPAQLENPSHHLTPAAPRLRVGVLWHPHTQPHLEFPEGAEVPDLLHVVLLEEGVGQRLTGCVPLLWVHHQEPGDLHKGTGSTQGVPGICKTPLQKAFPSPSTYQVLDGVRAVVPLWGPELVVPVHDHPQHQHLLAVPEGRRASQQGVHDHPGAPPAGSPARHSSLGWHPRGTQPDPRPKGGLVPPPRQHMRSYYVVLPPWKTRRKRPCAVSDEGGWARCWGSLALMGNREQGLPCSWVGVWGFWVQLIGSCSLDAAGGSWVGGICFPCFFIGVFRGGRGCGRVGHGGASKAGCSGAVSAQAVVCKVSWHGS